MSLAEGRNCEERQGMGRKGVWMVRERRRGEAGRREGEEVEQREGARERWLSKELKSVWSGWSWFQYILCSFRTGEGVSEL